MIIPIDLKLPRSLEFKSSVTIFVIINYLHLKRRGYTHKYFSQPSFLLISVEYLPCSFEKQRLDLPV